VRNWAELVDPEVFLRWATYADALRSDAVPTAKTNNVTQAGQNISVNQGFATQEGWLQVPYQEASTNPWLANSNPYCY